MKTAFFIGRFQPFHKGHMDAIIQILEECDKVVIGIGSPKAEASAKNPLSFSKRKAMIKKVLERKKLKSYVIVSVPDFEDDKDWIRYIKDKVPDFDIAYSANNETIKIMKKYGIRTKRVKLNLDISGTKIRGMISEDDDGWKKMVEKDAADEIDLEKMKKIVKLFSSL